MHVETLDWEGGLPGRVRLLEQTLLPSEERRVSVETVEEMVDAIRRLAVRGAPAIGVAAAYGVVLGVQRETARAPAAMLERVRSVARVLAASRPTAVNLFWALERMVARAEREAESAPDSGAFVDALLAEARGIHDADRDTCRRMGEIGATLIGEGATVLTHCNAGALATGGMGTALAPIYAAAEAGRRVAVFADETRPLLQGARLTAWELQRAGIPVTLIADGACARVMSEGRIDLVLVGSDRIARNGDVCNKIGTYGVALAAHAHGVPFYAVAPLSTFDASLESGASIPIEERAAEEVTEGFGRRTAPPGVSVYNPAFDVTPAALVTGIVTEVGIVERPDRQGVEEALRRGGVPLPALRQGA